MKHNLKHLGILWHLLLVGVLSFIFGNSLITPELSYSSSAAVTELIKPSQGVTGELLEIVLRKMAHLIEFATLGAVCIFLKKFYEKIHKPISIWFFVFGVLLMGVFDEWIQFFSGRSSSVSDVLLDFLGSLMGMAIATGIIKLKKSLNKGRNLL